VVSVADHLGGLTLDFAHGDRDAYACRKNQHRGCG
jgi:hypothetical protein